MLLASCAAPVGIDDFETTEVTVGDEVMVVALAVTPTERAQGLGDLEAWPEQIDGMLFGWVEPVSTTFTMSDVSFPLDIWFFDVDGRLVGSAGMNMCSDGGCTSYATPGVVKWALETLAGEWDFAPGTRLSNVENG